MIAFTQEDTDLFRISDKPLKAQAIKNSILPRLRELTNDAVADVAKFFGDRPQNNFVLVRKFRELLKLSSFSVVLQEISE